MMNRKQVSHEMRDFAEDMRLALRAIGVDAEQAVEVFDEPEPHEDACIRVIGSKTDRH